MVWRLPTVRCGAALWLRLRSFIWGVRVLPCRRARDGHTPKPGCRARGGSRAKKLFLARWPDTRNGQVVVPTLRHPNGQMVVWSMNMGLLDGSRIALN